MNYEDWKKHINNRYGNDTLEVSAKKQVNLKSDTEQYEKYLKLLGKKDIPETFEKWQQMKYNDTKRYTELKYDYVLKQHYDKSIEKGELTPLVDFTTYKKIDSEIKTKIVGLKTKNDIEVKSYSKHFIDRVCGSIEQKRSGVEIEDIIGTISTSNTFRESKRNDSIKIIGEKCIVSINPKTKNLIQVNPQ